MTNQSQSLAEKRTVIDHLRLERGELARTECKSGRHPIDNPRIGELDTEIERLVKQAATIWEQSADLSTIEAEEQVTVSRPVFELLLLHFESGLTRDEQLRLAFDSSSLPHLAAIRLCFDAIDRS